MQGLRPLGEVLKFYTGSTPIHRKTLREFPR
jgi:hypothetical protein